MQKLLDIFQEPSTLRFIKVNPPWLKLTLHSRLSTVSLLWSLYEARRDTSLKEMSLVGWHGWLQKVSSITVKSFFKRGFFTGFCLTVMVYMTRPRLCLCPLEGLHHREHCCERDNCNLCLKEWLKLALDGVIIVCLCTIVHEKHCDQAINISTNKNVTYKHHLLL